MNHLRFHLLPRLFVCLLSVKGAIRADPPADALILDLTGVVKLCKAKCTGTDWAVLDPKTDSYRLLHRGDQLQCESGSILHLYYAETKSPDDKTAQNANPQNACTVGPFVVPKRYEAIESRRTLSDFNAYRIAGRRKGAETMFFVPPDEGSVYPEKLIVRWRARPPLKTVSISVKSSDGAVVFSQTGLDGSTGTLDSADLRSALAALREDPARNRGLAITLQAPMRADDSIHFSLLSRADVEALEKQLSAVPPSPPGVRAIARASVYESAHVYDLVAKEYEEALKQAPESLDLLRVAYSANTRTGNLQRARDLLDRLEAVEGASSK